MHAPQYSTIMQDFLSGCIYDIKKKELNLKITNKSENIISFLSVTYLEHAFQNKVRI